MKLIQMTRKMAIGLTTVVVLITNNINLKFTNVIQNCPSVKIITQVCSLMRSYLFYRVSQKKRSIAFDGPLRAPGVV